MFASYLVSVIFIFSFVSSVYSGDWDLNLWSLTLGSVLILTVAHLGERIAEYFPDLGLARLLLRCFWQVYTVRVKVINTCD